MKIIIIASISNNNIIGNDNKLLWYLPNDLKQFKKLTTGHIVLMGRKTFESIGKPLINRENIILTRNRKYYYPGIKIYLSINQAINKLNKTSKKIFVIGGEQIYQQTIEMADIMQITKIHKNFKGDAKFPIIDHKVWSKVSEISYYKNNINIYDYTFIHYKKNSYKKIKEIIQ